MKKDLTIIYYTANCIDKNIDKIVKHYLFVAAQNIPIISVSQKPINFGNNICVGEIGQKRINIYRQILTGLIYADTKYIALAEDDVIYSPNYFLDLELSSNRILYNKNRWNFKINKNIFYQRNQPVLNQCIAPRAILMSTLLHRLQLEKLPDKYNGEPGKYEKILGIPRIKYDMFLSKKPNLIIMHKNDSTPLRKAKLSTVTKKIPYWGTVDNISRILELV